MVRVTETTAHHLIRDSTIRAQVVVSRSVDSANRVQMVVVNDIVLSGRGGDSGLVPVKHAVPAGLRTRPFTSAEASDVGVTRGQLRGAGYRRLGSGLYRWVGLKESPQLVLTAVARRLPTGAAFSGCTAAWLHGLDIAPCDPIEVDRKSVV